MSRKFRHEEPSCQNLEITGVLKTKDDEVESHDDEVLENQSHIPFSDAIKNPSNNFLMLNIVSHMLVVGRTVDSLFFAFFNFGIMQPS